MVADVFAKAAKQDPVPIKFTEAMNHILPFAMGGMWIGHLIRFILSMPDLDRILLRVWLITVVATNGPAMAVRFTLEGLLTEAVRPCAQDRRPPRGSPQGQHGGQVAGQGGGCAGIVGPRGPEGESNARIPMRDRLLSVLTCRLGGVGPCTRRVRSWKPIADCLAKLGPSVGVSVGVVLRSAQLKM